MKKLLLFLMLFVNLNAFSQTYTYKTKDFSFKYKTETGWSRWSNWEPSNMKVTIDLDEDLIIIYSSKIQVYSVIDFLGTYTDDSGGQQTKFSVIDQDDDLGYIRLRIETNGNSQIYVDFSDIMWVYNVVRVE